MRKLVIASAGGGKTTYLVQEALKFSQGKALITTFTIANEVVIKKRIYEESGAIPSHIKTQTWWSFLLEHGVRPYQGKIYNKDINGLQLVNRKSGFRYMGKSGPVYYSEEKDLQNFYFSKNGDIYSDKISQFVLKCNKVSGGKVLERLSKCFKLILIDEIQDLSGYDLEFLKEMFKHKIDVILVGDPRQATYSTSNSAKNKKYSKGKIVDFFRQKSLKVDIDDSLLKVNFRCVKEICDLSNKLYPGFSASASANTTDTGHDGIFFVRPEDVEKYLQKYTAMQLRDSRAVSVNKNFDAMNFGGSKGLEFERVLIYPTTPMINWIKDNQSELKPTSRSDFYVALTRAKQSAAIVGDFAVQPYSIFN